MGELGDESQQARPRHNLRSLRTIDQRFSLRMCVAMPEVMQYGFAKQQR